MNRAQIAAGALAALLLVPSPGRAGTDNDEVATLSALVAKLAAQVEALSAQVAEQGEQLRRLSSQPPVEATQAATPQPPPPAAPATAAGGNYFNPSISLIGNFLAVGGHTPIEGLPSSDLRESELGLQAVVDPYARADFFLSFGEEGVDVEEGYLTFTQLPADLLVKVGRQRAAFGKINGLHLHTLPWPDEPLTTVNLLGGEEGWIGTGVSVSRLLPLGNLFSEATVQVFRGDAEGLFEARRRQDLAYNGHYRLFADLTEATNLDVGLSYGYGPNGITETSSTSLAGLDLTLRWKPLRTGLYRSAIVRGELIASRRHGEGGSDDRLGWFLSGEYQLARRWSVGARYELADAVDAPERVDRGQALLVTFSPTEFSQLRAEIRRRFYAQHGTALEGLLQLQFAIGAHGAHPF
ncbi:MAG: hypothetical protein U0002_05745 [Thermoanaerobaculia bacterium]